MNETANLPASYGFGATLDLPFAEAVERTLRSVGEVD